MLVFRKALYEEDMKRYKGKFNSVLDNVPGQGWEDEIDGAQVALIEGHATTCRVLSTGSAVDISWCEEVPNEKEVQNIKQ